MHNNSLEKSGHFRDKCVRHQAQYNLHIYLDILETHVSDIKLNVSLIFLWTFLETNESDIKVNVSHIFLWTFLETHESDTSSRFST